MNPFFAVIFWTSPISSSAICLIFCFAALFFSFSSLTTPLPSVMPGVRGTVYLWLRLFKFICGCQMSESLSLLSSHRMCVYYVFLISAVRYVCVCVIFLGLQLTVVNICWSLNEACIHVCVCVLHVCFCACVHVKWDKVLLQATITLVSDSATLFQLIGFYQYYNVYSVETRSNGLVIYSSNILNAVYF